MDWIELRAMLIMLIPSIVTLIFTIIYRYKTKEKLHIAVWMMSLPYLSGLACTGLFLALIIYIGSKSEEIKV